MIYRYYGIAMLLLLLLVGLFCGVEGAGWGRYVAREGEGVGEV